MIPLSLNLRNFMSYTDVHEPLRFDGIHVAVLAGDNGHGKSALLDAITWALWGRARGRSVDELIHAGATEMEVEFEFLLDDHQYRVIRKRWRRGRQGYSSLDFFISATNGYKPLTEQSVVETERLIERTLRMSYDTFTNSSFIQQGRADSFTINSPTERKRVLAEILELGTYDDLEARAKDAYRERESLLVDERRQAQLWDQEIARRPEYQAEADRLKSLLATADAEVARLEQQAAFARGRVAQLEALQRQLAEIEVRLQRFVADQQRLQANLAERRGDLAQAKSLLGRAEAVEQAAAELASVRRELETAEAAQQLYLPMERQRSAALSILSTERARLEGEISARARQIADLQVIVARQEVVLHEHKESHQALMMLVHVEQQHQRLQHQLMACKEASAEKKAVNAQLKKEMHELKARIEQLDRLAVCPTCERPMDPRHSGELRRSLTQHGKLLAERFRAHEAEYRRLDQQATQHEAHLQELAQMLQEREPLQRRVALAESAVGQLRDAGLKIGVSQTELAARQELLDQQRFAPEAREQLARAEAQLAELAYHEEAHARLRARAAELADVDHELQALERARLLAQHLRSQIGELEASLSRLDEECAAERQQQAVLQSQSDTLAGERQQLAELDGVLAELKQHTAEVRQEYHLVVSRLDTCAFYERKREESLARQHKLYAEQEIYATLATAFGKKGVQAMIIETAIPEIEDETNRLLGRMTDGRMHVKFETQREARTGSGTVETLDIKISDELGTRSYEMFSGGESFRVNFAIRIAMSRLLAHRAGTRLQTLVIDEGLGSQDQEGRDRVVEAIQAIEDEFEKILVITHLEDLRERFPVRIEVQKTPKGSVFALR
ncbi:MAG TPA: SMC family ATPase [Chloroflexota bacterium]|nr:SMC family ATPase [Chloroflexota bacterium]